MQRGGSLHRETPIPGKGLEQSSRRPSGSLSHLSVGSIQESEEEENIRDSATSLMESKNWGAGNGKVRALSPIPSGKQSGSVAPKSGTRRVVSSSGQSSPTGSQDSQGSGATSLRSVDSLHRPTPIPSDASASFAVPGSFGRRTSGRAQPQTPTISEFEGDDDEAGRPLDLAALPDLLEQRHQSLGGRSSGSGSLHRTTPMPMDLVSTSTSSGGRLHAHRSTTPTIQENDHDRSLQRASGESMRSTGSLHRDTPMPQDLNRTSAHSVGHSAHPITPTICEEDELIERDSDLDSNEHYYGRAERLDTSDVGRVSPIVGRIASPPPAVRPRGKRRGLPQTEPQTSGRDGLGGKESPAAGRGGEQVGSVDPRDPAFTTTWTQNPTPAFKFSSPLKFQRHPPLVVNHHHLHYSQQSSASDAQFPASLEPKIQPAQQAVSEAAVAPTLAAVSGSGVVTPSTSGKLPTPSNQAGVSPPSPFSPFVESKDWERDILGVARFLRMCPGLSRQLIGDLLGENNERCLRVLECFTASFDFTGLSFEAALREYLESFRLPGESQKIYRILESWSRQFHRQCPGIFRSADAVLVLAFSLVLLNTDRHKSTVKKKMTCEEFVRNNKGVNDGQDFPAEFLEELYRNIERRAIRIPPAHPADNLLHHNSLPEPIRTARKQYESPERARPTGWLCF